MFLFYCIAIYAQGNQFEAEIPSIVKLPDAVWLLGLTLLIPSTNCREISTEPTNPNISGTLEPEKQPLFRVMKQHIKMVLEMLQFIRAVRTANWELHLMALESFTKYFFAHDKVNYAPVIPLYLAEMKSLKETDLEIYNEFMEGNWVVNKNSDVPFCALGADHALEHINRSMKVTGGLVGITEYPNKVLSHCARTCETCRGGSRDGWTLFKDTKATSCSFSRYVYAPR